ncbi:hypothetical protein ACLBX9_10215 [Methylobacterium sp. A49B]
MSRTVIPFRRRPGEASALAAFDAPAAQLLADGRAGTLSAAQLSIILTKFRAQRDELAAIIADLDARAPSSDPQINIVNANLKVAAREGLVQINVFIHQAETSALVVSGGRPRA